MNDITHRRKQIKFFNTMHSFKQAVVLPWGIKRLKKAKLFDRMKEFVQKVIWTDNLFIKGKR